MHHPRWRYNLQVLGLPDAVRAPFPTAPSSKRDLESRLPKAPPLSGVVLNGRGSQRAVRAEARALRVQVEREFLAFPSHASPAYLVESTPGAMAYFCSSILTVPPATTLLSLPVDLGLRTLQRGAPREALRALARNRVVVGHFGGRSTRERVGPEDGKTEEETLGPSRYRSPWSYPELEDLDLVVIGTSKDPNAKVTVLGIDRQGGGPVLAVKVPTTDIAQSAIDVEGRLLVDLQRRCPVHVLPTIPRVRDLVTFEGRLGLVTTGMTGTPMSSSYLRWRHFAGAERVSSDLRTVSRWLAGFQTGTAGGRASIDICSGLAEPLRLRFADEPGLAADLDALEQIDRRLREEKTPRTAVHGDFWCGNVLLRDGEVSGVIDWESGSISGEPLRDLVRFAIVYAAYLDRHTRPGHRVAGHRNLYADSWGAGVRYAVDGSGWFPSLFRAFVVDGLRRLGVNPQRWRDAILAGLVEIAVTADHHDFARHHYRLFRQLAGSPARTTPFLPAASITHT